MLRCRICGNTCLTPIIDLGKQAVGSIFPKTKSQKVPSGPLELLKCSEDKAGGTCGLVQLKESYKKSMLYGWNYGYRSGLNRSMVAHLQEVVRKILQRTRVDSGDLVLDIGSNDGTLLRSYPQKGPLLAGIDPTGLKFKKYYPPHVRLIPDFFSAKTVRRAFGKRKAKIVTSLAMFYDLDSPMDFMREVGDILADDGCWVLEQSYLPSMLATTSYDTICHEHLEYYRLKQIHWMAQRTGFKIAAVEFNDINGGSFLLKLVKTSFTRGKSAALVRKLLNAEERRGLGTLEPYRAFEKRVFRHREHIWDFFRRMQRQGKLVFGYGASTKGNVLLQFCKLSPKELPAIAEINEDKVGCFTPGTLIPIISEKAARAARPDVMMVLPWHFKKGIVARERNYLRTGGRLFFPLPSAHLVSR
ncbi:MAG: class I SAM-dependent methyltransferase [Candidatus Omnitrophica bacterium]|nr:class I SAM-dependent methyltransferase [Candidatus Omnitrophota bacterium]